MKENNALYRKILRLVLPIAFQQFMLALVGASDAVMLGMLDQDAMSAVSLASQLTFLFNLFMMAFVTGENMFVAQYFGKRDEEHISSVFHYVLRIAVVVAAVFALAAVFVPEWIMTFLTNDPGLQAMGVEYLQAVAATYLLSAVSQVCLTVMKNCGAVLLSTVISSAAVVMNIIMNAVLIFGLAGFPALGIRGAALATVLSTLIQMIWCLWYVLCKMTQVQVRLRRTDRELASRFWEKVFPVLVNELAWGGGFTMYSVIMGHLGTDAVAANSIANISKNLVVCLCLGLGSAGGILVGNELGADHFEEARTLGRTLTKAAVLCGAGSGFVLLCLSPLICRAAGLTPQATEYLQWMLVMSSYYIAGKSVNCMTIGGIFAAGGDSKFGMICDSVTLWCVTVPLGSVCAFVLKLPVLAVYFVLNLDEVIKLPAVFIHYRKYRWLKNIT